LKEASIAGEVKVLGGQRLNDLASPATALASDFGANLTVKEGSPPKATPKRRLTAILAATTPKPVKDASPLYLDPTSKATPLGKFFRGGKPPIPPFDATSPSTFHRTATASGRLEAGSGQVFQDVSMAASPMDVSPAADVKSADYFSQTVANRTRSKVADAARLSAPPRQKMARTRSQFVHWNQRRGASEPNISVNTSKLPRPSFLRQTSEITLPSRKRDTRSPEPNPSSTNPTPMNIDTPNGRTCQVVTTHHQPIKMRRTQSFGGAVAAQLAAEEVMQGVVPSSFGIDEMEESVLPWEAGKGDAHKRIDAETLANLLDGHYDTKLDKFHIIDCRFPYEYEGGHISGATNVNTKGELDEIFFKTGKVEKGVTRKRVVVVFHCEFSSHRAPTMASYMRSRDRAENMDNYPALYYPEIYVLKGGYKQFYAGHKNRCEPQQYIEMADKTYLEDLKKNRAIHKREFGRSFSEGFLKRN
ncbi:cell division cycle- protein, partial [Rhizophlyctis rosea]